MKLSTNTSLFLSCALVVVLLPAASQVGAWLHGRECAQTGESCTNEGGCCSKDNVCVTLDPPIGDEIDYTRRRRCMPIVPPRRSRPAGSSCTDSRQCQDRCCRTYNAHRYGPVRMCGPQKGYHVFHYCRVITFEPFYQPYVERERRRQMEVRG